MKVISKFILNRNNTQFFYVEKKEKARRIKYFVHLSPENILEYNDHNFHNIHSIDEKISINMFAKHASDNLLSEIYDSNSEYGYNLLRDVYERTNSDSDRLNPNIKRVKKSLLHGIKIYNDVIQDIEVLDIPYQENFDLVNDTRDRVNKKQKVQAISSLISKDNKNKEALYNVSVKELVRIKK